MNRTPALLVAAFGYLVSSAQAAQPGRLIPDHPMARSCAVSHDKLIRATCAGAENNMVKGAECFCHNFDTKLAPFTKCLTDADNDTSMSSIRDECERVGFVSSQGISVWAYIWAVLVVGALLVQASRRRAAAAALKRQQQQQEYQQRVASAEKYLPSLGDLESADAIPVGRAPVRPTLVMSAVPVAAPVAARPPAVMAAIPVVAVATTNDVKPIV